MTIAKISFFVILSASLLASCGSNSAPPKVSANNPHFDTPRIVGKIKSKAISESSGVAVSSCQPDVLWTHNDGGNDDLIFAISPSGELLGTYRVKGVTNEDWEDIAAYKDAAGKCFVYIGEIGDNDAWKAEHKVYRIPEPQVGGLDPKRSVETETPQTVRFRYPDENQNSETLMVQRQTGDIYVATKRKSGPSRIYRIKAAFDDSIQTAEKVGEISVPSVPNGLLTGGDISPDGRHAIVCDYTQGYELSLPDGAANFDDIWRQTPLAVDLGKRPHGESVGYNADGTAVYATSEEDNAPIIEVKHRQ
jgi:DNA-binding beta-propeller fold protein YncE